MLSLGRAHRRPWKVFGMIQDNETSSIRRPARIAWADTAKGFCIVLVVMLYAAEHVEGVTGSAGWIDAVVAFARPFRMPDFFLVSGVLLTPAIHRDWRTFLDRKVMHFAYFYVLWLTILVAFASPWIAARTGWSGVGEFYLRSFVRPYSMLWFIYLLPFFYVVTKAVQRAPAALVWTCAAALQVAHLETDIKVFDKFAAYYVFFYSGYIAPHVLRVAEAASSRPALALAALGSWSVLNGYLVAAGLAPLPGVSLAWGLVGACALVAASALMAKVRLFMSLAYCGRNSLAVYLAFAIPLAVASKLIFSSGLIRDPGSIVALVTLAAVAGALILERLVRGTVFRFLFERPVRFWLGARNPAPATARRLQGFEHDERWNDGRRHGLDDELDDGSRAVRLGARHRPARGHSGRSRQAAQSRQAHGQSA
ncbi:MAG: acyltransferase family protein [Betaproteobacteria bacterium]